MNIIDQLTSEYDSELQKVANLKSRKPYLVAMLLNDLQTRRILVAEVKQVESKLRSLGHDLVSGELVEDLHALASRIPDNDPDIDLNYLRLN